MKRSFLLMIVLLSLCLAMATPAFAAASDLVTDGAGVLTDEECRELNVLALEITEKYACEVIVFVTEDMGSADAFDFAKKVYQNNEYGYGPGKSGLMLFLSIAEKDFALISYGYGEEVFPAHIKDTLLDSYILPLLAENRYYDAFCSYLDNAAIYLEIAQNGVAQNGEPEGADADVIYQNYSQSTPYRYLSTAELLITLIVPIVVALIVCLIFRSQMKTAKLQREASHYVPEGGFVLTGSRDAYLYSTETRTKIESNSGSGGEGGGGGHISSDGFSGRSGKF